MAISQLEFISRVSYRLEQRGQGRKFTPEAVESLLSAALLQLGERIASDPNPALRARLQGTFTATITGGIADLSPFTTLKIGHIATGYVTHPNINTAMQYLPNRTDLDNPPNLSDYYYYTIFNNSVIAVDNTGAAVPNGAITIVASQNPSLPQVPDSLVDRLLNIAVGLALENPADNSNQ